MTAKVSYKQDGYSDITPYLIVKGASHAIEFYKKAFGATEILRSEMPDGKIGHAELTIGDSKIMLADEFPAMKAFAPQKYGGSPVTLHLYVKDMDAVLAAAVKLGAKLTKPAEDMFYGDRSGSLEDPFGHNWYISTHIEDVSDEETQKRMEKLYGSVDILPDLRSR